MSNGHTCDLSIVVAWQESQPNVEDCLDSLYGQETQSTVEIILAYGGFKPDPTPLINKYPKLKIVEHPASGSIPSLHGIGIAQSCGDLIAITEAHTTFAKNWFDTAISVARASSDAAIGGAVEPGTALSSVDFALYLCDYVQFALPFETGSSDDLPGNNIVFKRKMLDQYLSGKDLSNDGFWKTFFCHELIEKGERLSRHSSMVAYYNRHLSFNAVMERRYHHGRCFGAMRSTDFDAGKKALYLASCAGLPLILMSRLIQKVAKKRFLVGRFLRVYPICKLIICAWVAGEYCGMAAGANGSCDKL
ncbi:MAG: hypothetical protein JST89_07925 [Cyanobacteria bacterium SZAS-4]|nr:hypothetical protein [Cyanobacteria bacterium SZAS-4]